MEGDYNQEHDLTLEEQVELANKLLAAIATRDEFPKRWGGFDEFSEIHQYVGDNRRQYDELWSVYLGVRKEFDEKVKDKKALIDHLRNTGANELADKISMMFRVK